MTEGLTDVAAPPATGMKAKANALGMKAYLAAPPRAQTAMLNGFVKAQPVAAKVKPHSKKLLGALVGLLAVRKVRGRRK